MAPAFADLKELYLRAQLAGDRREAVRLVVEEGLGKRGASVIELQSQVIGAAQDEIGRLWQMNLVTIAQEHMATAISHLTLAALFERAKVAKPVDKKLVMACVEGEHHDLPARLVSDLLEIHGFDVRFLGANVPHDHLAAMVREERPALIGLSVTMSFNLTSLREAVSRVRVVTDAPIFVGGHALAWSPGIDKELGLHVAGTTPDDVLATARRLTGLVS
jgi:MerR family transcriptional regulator, light-induced transcriptional regulator